MALGPLEFKNNWMIGNGVDPDALLAAEALMPSPSGDIAALVNIPENDGTIVGPTRIDIPGVGEDQSVWPIGYFGERFPEGHPTLKYAPNPGMVSPHRGGQVIKGGIPVPEGVIYDDENSRKEWPTYFEGVTKGNMPAYAY